VYSQSGASKSAVERSRFPVTSPVWGGVAPLEIVWCTTWITMGYDCESLVSVALWELALKWVLNR